jgi:hypothetical protein
MHYEPAPPSVHPPHNARTSKPTISPSLIPNSQSPIRRGKVFMCFGVRVFDGAQAGAIVQRISRIPIPQSII